MWILSGEVALGKLVENNYFLSGVADAGVVPASTVAEAGAVGGTTGVATGAAVISILA